MTNFSDPDADSIDAGDPPADVTHTNIRNQRDAAAQAADDEFVIAVPRAPISPSAPVVAAGTRRCSLGGAEKSEEESPQRTAGRIP